MAGQPLARAEEIARVTQVPTATSANARSKWDDPGSVEEPLVYWPARCGRPTVFSRMRYQQKHCQLGLKRTEGGHNDEKTLQTPNRLHSYRKSDIRTEQRDLKMLVLKVRAIHVQARKSRQPSEAWRGKEQIPFKNLQKGGGPVNILILFYW